MRLRVRLRSVFDQPAQLARALNVPTRPNEAMRRRVPFTFVLRSLYSNREIPFTFVLRSLYSNREMPMSFAESSLIRAKRTPFSFFS